MENPVDGRVELMSLVPAMEAAPIVAVMAAPEMVAALQLWRLWKMTRTMDEMI